MKEELCAKLARARARQLKTMQLVANMIAYPENYPSRDIKDEIFMMNYHTKLIGSLVKRIESC